MQDPPRSAVHLTSALDRLRVTMDAEDEWQVRWPWDFSHQHPVPTGDDPPSRSSASTRSRPIVAGWPRSAADGPAPRSMVSVPPVPVEIAQVGPGSRRQWNRRSARPIGRGATRGSGASRG